MKSKIDKKNLIIFLVGVLLIIGGVLAIDAQNQKAKAATNYTINWEASKYINIQDQFNRDRASIEVVEWNVLGNVGGSIFNEKWVVSESLSQMLANTGGDSGMTGHLAVGDLKWPPEDICSAPGTTILPDVMGRGSYSTRKPGYGQDCVISAVYIPTKWTVTGTIQ